MDNIANRIAELANELAMLDRKNTKLSNKATAAEQNVAQVELLVKLYCAKTKPTNGNQPLDALQSHRILRDLTDVCSKAAHDLNENQKERAMKAELLKSYISMQNTLKRTLDESEMLPSVTKRQKTKRDKQQLLITEQGRVTIPLGLPKEYNLLVVTIDTDKSGKYSSAAVYTTTGGNLEIEGLHNGHRYKFVVRMLDGSKRVYVARHCKHSK